MVCQRTIPYRSFLWINRLNFNRLKIQSWLKVCLLSRYWLDTCHRKTWAYMHWDAKITLATDIKTGHRKIVRAWRYLSLISNYINARVRCFEWRAANDTLATFAVSYIIDSILWRITKNICYQSLISIYYNIVHSKPYS